MYQCNKAPPSTSIIYVVITTAIKNKRHGREPPQQMRFSACAGRCERRVHSVTTRIPKFLTVRLARRIPRAAAILVSVVPLDNGTRGPVLGSGHAVHVLRAVEFHGCKVGRDRVGACVPRQAREVARREAEQRQCLALRHKQLVATARKAHGQLELRDELKMRELGAVIAVPKVAERGTMTRWARARW